MVQPGAVVNILVLNCGASSVKFQIIATDGERIDRDDDRRLVRGAAERIGGHALLTFQIEGRAPVHLDAPLRDPRAAIDAILRWIVSEESSLEGLRTLADLHAVGHRVVHGGERFKRSMPIDAEVLAGIEECIALAPLHNPANLRGIKAAAELLGPGIPQVAVFDTAFHSNLPEVAFLYAIPYPLYRRHQIRRYGFHGTSHRYVAYRYRTLRAIPREQVQVITLHLGNGCSAAAIKNGQSIDTSMGFTPLEGLIMATRSGDVDPSIVEYLMHAEGLTLSEVDALLNKQSGLLGISGLTADMRDLLEEESDKRDRRAALAIEMFCYRARKYVGSYFAAMAGADALVFTGGIGENAPSVRRRICDGLECLGLVLDPAQNERTRDGACGKISREGSSLEAYVIPTDEELLIARDTYRVVAEGPKGRLQPLLARLAKRMDALYGGGFADRTHP